MHLSCDGFPVVVTPARPFKRGAIALPPLFANLSANLANFVVVPLLLICLHALDIKAPREPHG